MGALYESVELTYNNCSSNTYITKKKTKAFVQIKIQPSKYLGSKTDGQDRTEDSDGDDNVK